MNVNLGAGPALFRAGHGRWCHTRCRLPPGSDRPGLTLQASRSGDPGPLPGVLHTPVEATVPVVRAPWKGTPMATKHKPQTDATTDEAREQMRRALQTSMDTRQ
jgi:hypothetical protein